MYNKSKIFKAAWKMKKEKSLTISAALKAAWTEAKNQSTPSPKPWEDRKVSGESLMIAIIDNSVADKVFNCLAYNLNTEKETLFEAFGGKRKFENLFANEFSKNLLNERQLADVVFANL